MGHSAAPGICKTSRSNCQLATIFQSTLGHVSLNQLMHTQAMEVSLPSAPKEVPFHVVQRLT